MAPKKETISHTFVNLVENMQKYKKKDINSMESLHKICIVISKHLVTVGNRNTDHV